VFSTDVFKTEIRILKLLAAEQGSYYPAEICRILKTNGMTTARKLAILEKEGMVISVQKGRTKFYSISEKGKNYLADYSSDGLEPVVKRGEEKNVSTTPEKTPAQDIEVHVAGICLRKVNGKFQVLLAQRSPSRPKLPNLFSSGGGSKFTWESIESCLERLMAQDFGAMVQTKPFGKFPLAIPYEIFQEKDKPYVAGFAIICTFNNPIGEELALDKTKYVDGTLDWYDLSDLGKMRLIPKLAEEIEFAAGILEDIRPPFLIKDEMDEKQKEDKLKNFNRKKSRADSIA
jgi:DNA-binding transcriptional ArsR family regulator